jgi:hypothetical protein
MEGALWEHSLEPAGNGAAGLGNNTPVTVDGIDCRIQCPNVSLLPREWPLWVIGATHTSLFPATYLSS